MRVPPAASHGPVRGAGEAPDLEDAVAPLGRAVPAGLLPWRLHRVDLDGAELKSQYAAVTAVDGAGLAGAHKRVKAAVVESELVRSQEGVNAIGPVGTYTEMN